MAELRVSTSPSDAKLYFDDDPLEPNPFVRKFMKDGSRHTLRAEAPGYETQRETITLTGDAPIVVTLNLQRATGTKAAQPKSPGKETQIVATPPTAPPAPSITSGGAIDTMPTKRPPKKIDTENPFESK